MSKTTKTVCRACGRSECSALLLNPGMFALELPDLEQGVMPPTQDRIDLMPQARDRSDLMQEIADAEASRDVVVGTVDSEAVLLSDALRKTLANETVFGREIAPVSRGNNKNFPLASGVLDYFPDALMEVAYVSKVGNEQHNPGEPLHWAKEKSTDEADALMRHLRLRGTYDHDGVKHTAKVAWRALALLQRELDAEKGAN